MTKTVPASVEDYKRALETIRPKLPKTYLEMLKAHYLHPDQALIPVEIAEAAGYKTVGAANLHYGKLGKRVLKALGDYEPTRRGHDKSAQWTMVIAKGYEGEGSHGGWLWVLRPQVSEALDQLGWFPGRETDNTLFADMDHFNNEPTTPHLSRTERESLVQSRIGQGIFRNAVLDYWDRKCSVTGVQKAAMLRASHIKPWRYSDNRERLDHFNGLLLQPNLDVAFDACLISFNDDGQILISKSLSESDMSRLGIRRDMKLSKIEDAHKPYLAYHREMFHKKQ